MQNNYLLKPITMRSVRISTLHLTTLLTALLHFCPEFCCLEISPSNSEVVMAAGDSMIFTCSGWGTVGWRFKRDDNVPYFGVENQNTTSVLILDNVTWSQTGVYVYPDVWFIESSHGMVTKTSEEGTIPCVVTNPQINVTLYERDSDMHLKGVYIPSEGYRAPLEDRTYVCRGELNGEEKESQAFYVFSIAVPETIDAYINASKTVLKQGEPLTVNCTVHGVELVYFSWDYPNRDVDSIEPLTDVLSSQRMRSCLIVSKATLAHTGQYVCHVHEGVQDQSATANVNITVLEQGFVELRSVQERNISAQLHQNVELRVEIEAYPPPRVRWTKDDATVNGDNTVITRQEHETRYVSTLTLVRIRTEQKGLYTVHITDLSDHHLPGKRHAVTCVAEGVPSPTIQWFSCDTMLKCSNRSTVWQPLVSDPETLSVQTNVSFNESRKVGQIRSQVIFHKPQQVTVRCEASNERGLRRRDVKLVSSTLFSQVAVLATVLALVVILIISIIVLIAVWRKKPRYEIRWKVIESVSLDGHEYIYVDPIHLPYDLAWEMPRDSLVLGRTLGSGAFGRVVEATAYGLGHSQSSTKVAVKMLKCPLYLVTEYCRYGDLVDYLHRNKHTFLQYYAEKNQEDSGCRISGGSTPLSQRKGYVSFGSECDGGYMDMSKDEPTVYVPMQELKDTIKYADIQASPYESPYQHDLYQEQDQNTVDSALFISDSTTLSYSDLIGFSYQVAKGMEFLASKNTFLPLKWMAPESIFHNLYTTLSDVWSYGILLWEIFTLGGTPYPDLPMNELFYSALKRGYRMAKPNHATDEVYEVMQKCWDEKHEKRPEFSFLVHTMGNMLTDSYKKRYCQVNDEFFKSDHPAVVRTKPRLSSPFPTPAITPSTAPDTPQDLNPYPLTGDFRPEADGEEVTASYNDYIIPIPDPKPEEEVFSEANSLPTESPASSLALEEDGADSISQETAEADTIPEEDGLHANQALIPLESSGTPEVEDSFL
ncbi:unnamed protein product [Coregonus sp. 'balchen']|nr:unnamed protein product [Coregonus sp. 'balchen']